MTNHPNLAATRRSRLAGWLLMLLAWAAIGTSFPVDGLLGVLLALAGVAVLWCGWSLTRRKPGGSA